MPIFIILPLRRFSIPALFVFFLIPPSGFGQTGQSKPAGKTEKERSSVLKGHEPERSPFRLKINRTTEELFNAFMVVTEANAGDPVAQHELGLRYLLGKDFRPDTAKAALWIGRSAGQDYLPARYNRGVLRNNGWGMEWDPFGAYRDAKYTADKGVVEGLFMYGLMFTDDLVVERDYTEAYHWILAASDSGYGYADEVLAEFERAGILEKIRTDSAASKKSPASKSTRRGVTGAGLAITPVFLDLSSDTLADPGDEVLIAEALGRPDTADSLESPPEPISGISAGSPVADSLDKASRAGSPEALTLLGRMHQLGTGVPKSIVESSAYYLRAMRTEARWAPVLLWRFTKSDGYFDTLRTRIEKGDLVAGYVWASLVLAGFDQSLTGEQAVEYLERGAAAGITDAQIGLAMHLYGRGGGSRDADVGGTGAAGANVDAARADSLLGAAVQSGSREAETRLMMSELRRAAHDPSEDSLMFAREEEIVRTASVWAGEGSLLAQVVLAYCSEKGMGTPQNIPVAVSLYRRAASRGSRISYDALRNLYDERRPPDPEFKIGG